MGDLPPSEASHDLAHAFINAMMFVRYAPMPQGRVIADRDAEEVVELARALDRWKADLR
jgi:hypothetical protein